MTKEKALLEELTKIRSVMAVLRRYLELEEEIGPASMAPEILSGLACIAGTVEDQIEGAIEDMATAREGGQS